MPRRRSKRFCRSNLDSFLLNFQNVLNAPVRPRTKRINRKISAPKQTPPTIVLDDSASDIPNAIQTQVRHFFKSTNLISSDEEEEDEIVNLPSTSVVHISDDSDDNMPLSSIKTASLNINNITSSNSNNTISTSSNYDNKTNTVVDLDTDLSYDSFNNFYVESEKMLKDVSMILDNCVEKNSQENGKKVESLETNSGSSSNHTYGKTIVLNDSVDDILSFNDYCKETEKLLKDTDLILNKFIGEKTEDNQKKNEKKEDFTEKPNVGTCPICLEKFQESTSVTLCGHIFCTECIRATVKATKCCPICRTKLTLKKFHPIYFS